tara:strand:+ start:738 stop:1181 length:444 start_codon:yes stop_codon:yes gene_type:complete
MIQLTRGKDNDVSPQTFYINVADEMTNTDYKPLIRFTNQLSGEDVLFIPFNASYTNESRYVGFEVMVIVSASVPLLGFLNLGTKDLPFGLYDVTMYQNTDNTNLDPTGLTTIWEGLMNLTARADFPAVQYNQYNTNDTETEAVYITF